MTILNNERVIAIEEHYVDSNVMANVQGTEAAAAGPIRALLDDVGEARIQSMDAAGIDVQVFVARTARRTANERGDGVRIARDANDTLHQICQNHPDRFAAFAMLPTADAAASADELERCVDKLGFKGAIIHGLTGDARLFIDDKQFWPIFERGPSARCTALHPSGHATPGGLRRLL